MQDFEYVTEPAPGDITPDRLAKRAATGMSKFFGVVASSMAVAGGLFVGNVLTAPNQSANGTEGQVGVDGAFADGSDGSANHLAGAATPAGSNGTPANAAIGRGFLPAGSSFGKTALVPGSKPGASALPGVVQVKGVDFANATTASPAWTDTTAGTTTSATTATSGTGTTTGTTTNATSTASSGGKDDGDDKDDDKDDGD